VLAIIIQILFAGVILVVEKQEDEKIKTLKFIHHIPDGCRCILFNPMTARLNHLVPVSKVSWFF
jgi:hypothetical protein